MYIFYLPQRYLLLLLLFHAHNSRRTLVVALVAKGIWSTLYLQDPEFRIYWERAPLPKTEQAGFTSTYVDVHPMAGRAWAVPTANKGWHMSFPFDLAKPGQRGFSSHRRLCLPFHLPANF